MSKYSTFRESATTERENSFNYRVEWDDKIDFNSTPIQHLGPDHIDYEHNYDEAWEAFVNLKHALGFRNVKLVTLDNDWNVLSTRTN